MNINRIILSAVRRKTNSRGGFTLVEIMVVMTILGMLAALVIPNVMGRVRVAKQHDCLVQIKSIEAACEMYKLDVGKFPDSLEQLVTNPGADGWEGPYLKGGRVPKDPWKESFAYEVINNGRDVKISSTGGGEKTISNLLDDHD
jgi:general secretion pathway protein G